MTDKSVSAKQLRENDRKKTLLTVLKRQKEFLSVTAPDGTAPVVVAFADELIRDVFEKVSWSDGYATIVVDHGDKWVVIPTSPSAARGAHGRDANVLPVADTCDMGMLIHGLESAAAEGEAVQLRVHGAMSDLRVLQAA